MTFFKKQLQFTNTLTDSGKKREKLQRRAHFFQYNTVFWSKHHKTCTIAILCPEWKNKNKNKPT